MPFGSVDPENFRRTCAKYATGIAVATVRDAKGEPHGLTVNSFTSVSCSPPLVLICIDHGCTVFPLFRLASYLGISVLRENQQPLSARFAQQRRDRFEGVEWVAGKTGVPLLPHALANIECGVRQIVPAGDHDIFIAEVVRAKFEDGRPLLYFNSEYRRLLR